MIILVISQNMAKPQKPNRTYKSNVFSLLFNDPNEVVELYNAITGNDLPPDTQVEITTIENPLFAGFHNDLAFTLGDIMISMFNSLRSLIIEFAV